MKEKSGSGINRRLALKYIVGGTLGFAGLAYGMNRNDLLAFLNRDAKNKRQGTVERLGKKEKMPPGRGY